ncbi:FecR family protein [Chitinophaga arvensicola]|uniref:FecR protein n=1 Tax=Chitinophaga arvensicola TaxID=29529 RepID=A0A1I0S9T7_9BACT|nr:FecR family protein [Chitinophaga arvensicola]SEW52814.1 FecR protein [Chitinophaga arvensicola]
MEVKSCVLLLSYNKQRLSMMNETPMPEDELPALLRAAKLIAYEKLDQLSEAEREELQDWLQQKSQHQEWSTWLSEGNSLSELSKEYAAFKAATTEALEAFHQQHLRPAEREKPSRAVTLLHFSWIRYAAAILLLLAVAWFFLPGKNTELARQTPKEATPVMPGQDGAILTLADGSTILLDAVGNGIVAHQGGADLSVKNGQLAYNAAGKASEEITFNKLTTPKGRQFKIQLPDGTIAWLNAASSIRFPTQFTGDTRRVDISGEVYFEAAAMVKAGKVIPFIVNADNRFEVTVLGTRFNVNAYADEPALNTTLLEGKVAVGMNRKSGRQQIILKPGDQASLTMRGDMVENMVVRAGDLGKVMAWKNGVFDFEDARIDEVMRQLKRWYDIDVKYESGVPDIEFVGKMTRDIPLNGLLIALEKSNVHFRLEGRTLIVMR